MPAKKPTTDEILKKYSRKIESQIHGYNTKVASQPIGAGIDGEKGFTSKEYFQFKQDMIPAFSKYEKRAKGLGNVVKLKVASKDSERIQKQLDAAHLDVGPSEVVGLALMSLLGLFFVGIMSSVAYWFITGSFPLLFLVLVLVASFFFFYYYYSMPSRLAVKWRLKAASQMVPAVLYTVVYMKHTSNLERAIAFVSEHIDAPLSFDFKKIIWDVQTGKFSSIKDSLDYYLDSWREHSMEFVESFHLIESSLYEPNEARRVQILERALRVILDGVYERMLKYTRTIKSPLTNLYMLGIVLPTLGLALLPLASTLLGGAIKWVHVFVIFNLIIPFFVFYLTMQVMLKRPGGHGESSLLERNPYYADYVSKRPYVKAFFICLPFLLLGLLPLYFQYVAGIFGFQSDYTLRELGLGFLGSGSIFGFIEGKGPFGAVSVLLSLFVPFSIAMFFALSFSLRTKRLIITREESKDLEREFNSSLFTLGNRLGDGTPAEIAFSKVAESTKGQKTENFFRIVHTNIQSMGMGLEEAIFNPKRGALVYYPSGLIATSMKILIESVKKGLNVAAQSLMSISEYVRNIHKINERLKDLLADVVSDMKSNMTFLAPLLAGIVVGLATMITGILGHLRNMMEAGESDTLIGGFGSVGDVTELFNIVNVVPPYFMQIAIGLYIVQIIFILSSTLVVVDSGEDRLKTTYEIGKNLIRGTLLYLITAFIAIFSLSLLVGVLF